MPYMPYERDDARIEKTHEILRSYSPVRAPVFRAIMKNLHYALYPAGCDQSAVFDNDMATLIGKGNVRKRNAGTSEIYEVVQ